jgi:DNA repair protein RecO (recombination protein O)
MLVHQLKKNMYLIFEVNDLKTLLNGLKLVGDYLDKTILKPNNINYPNSRLLFINSLK